MKINYIYPFSVLLSLGATLRVSGEKPVQKAKGPNVILILTDDMGFSDISCYGGKFAPTPNIDRMAKEGIQFFQYYSACPICSPSRTSILTGMYPALWNINSFLNTRKGNIATESADFLDSSAPTIAKAFKNAGYATGHFGKWHMGGGRDVDNAPGIKEYGFDEYNSTWESPDPDPLLTATDWIWSETDSVKRWDRTAYFVDKTLNFLKNNKGKPCYIDLWPDDVHTPWVPSQERFGLYPDGPEEERKFSAVLDEYDRQMGRLFYGLKQLGIDNNTLVIFTSDNGPAPSFRGSRAGGLRGQKGTLYEGGISMPFVVRWPGKIPAGKLDKKSLINATDLFISLCKISNVKLPKGYVSSGIDMSKAIMGEPQERSQAMYWRFGRDGEGKENNKSPTCAIRESKWKLLVNADGTELELYNLESDIKETTNVADQNRQITDKLKKQLLDWRVSLPKLKGN